MPFYEDEINYLISLNQKQQIQQDSYKNATPQQAKAIEALRTDYPWLSPGVAYAMAKKNITGDKAYAVAIYDLKNQINKNPDRWGANEQTFNHREKRLKAWIHDLDAIKSSQNNPTGSDWIPQQQRVQTFGAISDQEVTKLRAVARAALISGDTLTMNAALNMLDGRRSGQLPDPFTVAQQPPPGGAFDSAWNTVMNYTVDPTMDVAAPVVRTAGLALNSAYEALVATIRLKMGLPSAIDTGALLDAQARGESIDEMNARQMQGHEDAFRKFGGRNPLELIAEQTQAGQAVKALVEGRRVDVGSGFLPSPESATAKAAAAKAREYSPYLYGGAAWTPGRAVDNILGIEPDTPAATIISGLVDGAVSMYLDPGAAGLSFIGDVAKARRIFQAVPDAENVVKQIDATGRTIFRHSADELAVSISRPQGAHFGFETNAWPKLAGDTTIEARLAAANPLEVTKTADDAFVSVGELAAKKLLSKSDFETLSRLLYDEQDVDNALSYAKKLGVEFEDTTRAYLLSEDPQAAMDAIGGTLAKNAGHDAIVSVKGVDKSPAEVAVLSSSALVSSDHVAKLKTQMLADAGVVNGPRLSLNGRNPINWLYGQGSKLVEAIAAESDPHTIWIALGRRIPLDSPTGAKLIRDLADASDPATVRQILAGELGTSIDRIPKYRSGLNVPRRFSTDVPSGKIDLKDHNAAAGMIEDFLVTAKVPLEKRRAIFNQLVRSSGRGDDYAVVDAVFDAYRESLIAAGASAEDALKASRFARSTWQEHAIWSVDAMTGEAKAMSAQLADGTIFELPGSRWVTERYKDTVYLPDAREMKRLVASKEWRSLVNSDSWQTMIDTLDGAQAAWKAMVLLRPTWTVRVVGDELLRIAATGTSPFLHPFSHIALAIGNPEERWLTYVEKIGKHPDAAQIQSVMEQRARLWDELWKQGMDTEDIRRAVNLQHPLPRSLGQKMAAGIRRWEQRVGMLKVDMTGVPWDERGIYGEGMTDRFSDFKPSSRHYVNEFGVVNRTSDLWAEAYVEELYRVSMEPATRRALTLSPQEFADELWTSKWGKYLREQMAAGRDPSDPWRLVLNSRAHSDAYAQMIQKELQSLTGGNQDVIDALLSGKLRGASLVGPDRRAAQDAVKAAREMQKAGIGPNHVKIQKFYTLDEAARRQHFARLKSKTNTMFDFLMTRPSNYLSRSPTFRTHYWEQAAQLLPAMDESARAALLSNMDAANVPAKIESQIRDAARANAGKFGTLDIDAADTILKRRSLNHVQTLLYDLHKKSNFMDAARLVFPFGEAWKEILTVWGKTMFLDEPQVLRRVQQGIQAGRESHFDPVTGLPNALGPGFFHWDSARRQEVFSYPLSGELTKLFNNKVLSPLGMSSLMEIPIPMSGSISGLNMIGNGLPGVGPVLSVPLSTLLPDKPQYDKVRELLFPFGVPDQKGLGGLTDILAPAWLKKLDVFFRSPESDRLFGNTVFDVMAVNASTGKYDLQGPDATAEINRLYQDSKEQAKWMTVVRGAMAFMGAPSAPAPDFYVKGYDKKTGKITENLILLQKLRDDYRKMRNDSGSEQEAFHKFIIKYGVDNLLATQAKSTSDVVGLTPYKEQRDWARNHSDLVAKYPDIWAVFAPPGSTYDPNAYQAQLRSGDREPLTPVEMAHAANNRLASAIYRQKQEILGGYPFNVKEQAELRDLQEQLRQDYPGYQEDAPNPNKTALLISHLQVAARDPEIRDTPVGKAISAYFQFRERANTEAVRRKYSTAGAMQADKAAPIREWLRAQVERLINQYPDFERVWDLLLSRELRND